MIKFIDWSVNYMLLKEYLTRNEYKNPIKLVYENTIGTFYYGSTEDVIENYLSMEVVKLFENGA